MLPIVGSAMSWQAEEEDDDDTEEEEDPLMGACLTCFLSLLFAELHSY